MVVLSSFSAFAQTPEKALKSADLVKVKKSEVPGDLEVQVQQDFPSAGPVNIFTPADTAVTSNWKISEEIDLKKVMKLIISK